MKSHAIPLAAFLFITALCTATDAQNRPDLSLRETFDLYVRSIQQSDIDALFSTVTNEPRVTFLTSTGRLIDSREGYYRFHQDWFKETGWEMPVELLEVREGADYGSTLAIFHYRQKQPDGRVQAAPGSTVSRMRRSSGTSSATRARGRATKARSRSCASLSRSRSRTPSRLPSMSPSWSIRPRRTRST